MKSPKEKIRFNRSGVAKDIERLKKVAEVEFGPRAKRRDFYQYLGEVYRWVMVWKNAKKAGRLRTRLAEAMGQGDPRSNADAFHLVIAATCPKSKRTVSKFAIALSNAATAGVPPSRFETFLEEIGGPTTICTRGSSFHILHRIREAKKMRRPKR
jgi:hypothetical protein